MTLPPPEPLELFYSYSHKDEKLREQLETHLSMLKREGVISDWHDRRISAGQEWNGEIDEHLNSADMILLLVSSDFLASHYCFDIEVARAMERHQAKEAHVIPIILRPCDWNSAPFGKVQALPKSGKPVTSWKNRDDAFLDIAKAIRNAGQIPPPKLRKNFRPPASIPRPPVVGFVARRDSEGRDIVARLKEELTPQKNQLIALSGPGGVGKTTLAAEATRALSEVFGQRIVWISALGREDFALSTLLDEISIHLGHDDPRRLASESKATHVQTLIAAAPALAILDNFETIAAAEQVRCVEFLLNRASCPALITTRQKIASARNVAIPVMWPEEAETFLQLLIDQSGDPSVFIQVDRERIMQASECNPFIMQWVIDQIDLAQEANTVLDELAQGRGDAAKRVFERSFGLEHLGDEGRAALLALSLFAPDASRVALAEVAGFGNDVNRLNEAVKRLASLSLVKAVVGGSRLTVEGLTRELAKTHSLKVDHAGECRQRFLAYYVAYAESNPEPTSENIDALKAEKDNLLIAINMASDLADWSKVVSIGNASINILKTMFASMDEVCRKVTKAAGQADSGEELISIIMIQAHARMHRGQYETAQGLYELGRVQGWAREQYGESLLATYCLGHIAIKKGDLSIASERFNGLLSLRDRARSEKLKTFWASALRGLATIAEIQGDLEEAQRLCDESMELSREAGTQGSIADSLHLNGWIAQVRGDVDKAEHLYNEALNIRRELKDQLHISYLLNQLGEIAQIRGDIEQAEGLYDESFEIKRKWGDLYGMCYTLHRLGTLFRDTLQFEEACDLFGQSLAVREILPDLRGISETSLQLGLLEGNKIEAARLFKKALAGFEKLGSPDAEIARQCLAKFGEG